MTSELTELECRRAIDRIRHQEQLRDEEIADRLLELTVTLKSLAVVELTSPVLQRAKQSFPTVVKSLDALHLATAELAKCQVFFSLDKQQLTAAKALGLKTEI